MENETDYDVKIRDAQWALEQLRYSVMSGTVGFVRSASDDSSIYLARQFAERVLVKDYEHCSDGELADLLSNYIATLEQERMTQNPEGV